MLQLLARLAKVGVETYHADFRRSEITFYLNTDETLVCAAEQPNVAIATEFSADKFASAMKYAAATGKDVDYQKWLAELRGAGCVGYFVSVLTNRTKFFDRRGELCSAT